MKCLPLIGFVLWSSAWLPCAAADKKEDSSKLMTGRFVKANFQGKLPYRIYGGTDLDKTKKYPVVLFLHGAGERGHDNEAQLRHGTSDFVTAENYKARPCIVIAPQCPGEQSWTGEPGKLALELLEEIAGKLPVDRDRIYITGLSMGGFGSWKALQVKPGYFAAAIPICGAGDPDTAKNFKEVPIWVFHGDKDNAVKVEKSREMVAALKEAGGTPKYTEYPGVGHDSWTQTYADPKVMEWLFAQKKGSE